MIKEITNYKNLKEELKQFKKIKAFDTETTGLHPESGDRIIEYGTVTYDLETETKSDLNFLIDPEIKIPEALTQIHGIKDSDVIDCPNFKGLANRIRFDITEPDCLIIAHNAQFDINFLRWEFKRLGIDIDSEFNITYLCTRNLAKTLNKQGLFDNKGKNGLEHLALNVFNVPDPGHHRATNDCIVCYSVFKKLEDLIYH